MEVVGDICYLLGAAFVLIGAIGVLRFGDFMSRTHAAAKAPTLGLILVALGTAIDLHTVLAILTMALVVLAQLFTTPVGTHMLARAAHGEIEIELDGPDELARDKAALAAETAADNDADE
jgi:multicomponent Na+:H+ antiporter subunit G